MKSREDILKVLDELKVEIKEKYGVKQIGLFGSFVSGGHKSGSDIDVLVEFEEGNETFKNYMALKYFLEEGFGGDVDLVLMGSIKPMIRADILRGAVYV
ncbi:MAG: nucleotidyltransferase family protein [Candidatus Hydrothermarchaeales archaeon]